MWNSKGSSWSQTSEIYSSISKNIDEDIVKLRNLPWITQLILLICHMAMCAQIADSSWTDTQVPSNKDKRRNTKN